MDIDKLQRIDFLTSAMEFAWHQQMSNRGLMLLITPALKKYLIQEL